ncbi:hypothetical protein GCM10017781_16180 [Deinococcus metalli]|uniref:Uncharacterized protein n=1 Tax=Deinococcus metalli TaxID=1141878 RepID=A0ABQ3JNT6_9DEIO|nr:hypothetical protein GCM10017781_16180 [Deinococcus metalli]
MAARYSRPLLRYGMPSARATPDDTLDLPLAATPSMVTIRVGAEVERPCIEAQCSRAGATFGWPRALMRGR